MQDHALATPMQQAAKSKVQPQRNSYTTITTIILE
jgi:hypothetical protein